MRNLTRPYLFGPSSRTPTNSREFPAVNIFSSIFLFLAGNTTEVLEAEGAGLSRVAPPALRATPQPYCCRICSDLVTPRPKSDFSLRDPTTGSPSRDPYRVSKEYEHIVDQLEHPPPVQRRRWHGPAGLCVWVHSIRPGPWDGLQGRGRGGAGVCGRSLRVFR